MSKSVISIYIESLINEKATKYRLNKSQVCNEALKLAVLNLEQNTGQEQTQENALANFFNYKIQKMKDLKILTKLYRRRGLSQGDSELFIKVRNAFLEKYQMLLPEVIAILQKENPPFETPQEKTGEE